MAFRFESLDIWKLAIEYGNKLYNVVSFFPPEELYGLSSQLKRAGVSISSNIAEGSGASTNKDFANFLDISVKSALETVNILYFARTRNYIDKMKQEELYKEAEILIKKIRAFKRGL